MKKYLAVLVLALLFFGCTGGGQPQQQQPPAQPPGANQTPPVTPPKTSAFPMKITYTMEQQVQGVNQTFEITYWLEEEKTCDSRDAVVGIASIKEVGASGQQPYAKITVYLDNGEFVNSNFQAEQDLAFDTAKPVASDTDFMLLPNYIFKNAGRNFMNDPVWNSTDPTILKDVVIFTGIGNVSVIKIGESTSGAVPCTEFSFIIRGAGGNSGQPRICVAHITESNPLPYVVYVKPNEGGQSMSWSLKSVEKANSTVTTYKQCLSPVSCPKFTQPTQEEWIACNGNMSMEIIRDENNCITEYRCMTMKERAEKQLKSIQGPSCPIQQQIVDAIAACWGQNKNADFDRDNSGCITAVRCP